MPELINRAKELLADGTVARVLGWKAGDLPYNPEPAYFETEESLMKAEGVNVYLTIDREQEGWDGHVGFVPTYLKEIGFDTDKVALVCGPPIMIKFVLAGLQEMGFTKEQVYTTLELRMKCGVGKCGRCNIGSKYVCKDGPVFRFDEIDELPNEY